jgi:hypothetical protein
MKKTNKKQKTGRKKKLNFYFKYSKKKYRYNMNDINELNKLRDIINYYDNALATYHLNPKTNNEETRRHISLSRRLVQLDLMLMQAEGLRDRQDNTILIEFYLRETKRVLTELLDVVEILLENNLINEGLYLTMNNSLKVKYETTEEIEKTGECNFGMMRIN